MFEIILYLLFSVRKISSKSLEKREMLLQLSMDPVKVCGSFDTHRGWRHQVTTM